MCFTSFQNQQPDKLNEESPSARSVTSIWFFSLAAPLSFHSGKMGMMRASTCRGDLCNALHSTCFQVYVQQVSVNSYQVEHPWAGLKFLGHVVDGAWRAVDRVQAWGGGGLFIWLANVNVNKKEQIVRPTLNWFPCDHPAMPLSKCYRRCEQCIVWTVTLYFSPCTVFKCDCISWFNILDMFLYQGCQF